MTVYRRPDPIPLPDARPVHGPGRPVARETEPERASRGPAGSTLAAEPPGTGSRTLSQAVAEGLAPALMAGRFLRGGVLWTEPQLCAAFGVSRTALREGIRILAAKGLVETRRKSGTVLRPRAEWALLDPDVMRWLLAIEPDRTAADLAEAEGLLARAAAPRGGADQPSYGANPFVAAFLHAARATLRHAPPGSRPPDSASGGTAAAPARTGER